MSPINNKCHCIFCRKIITGRKNNRYGAYDSNALVNVSQSIKPTPSSFQDDPHHHILRHHPNPSFHYFSLRLSFPSLLPYLHPFLLTLRCPINPSTKSQYTHIYHDCISYLTPNSPGPTLYNIRVSSPLLRYVDVMQKIGPNQN